MSSSRRPWLPDLSIRRLVAFSLYLASLLVLLGTALGLFFAHHFVAQIDSEVHGARRAMAVVAQSAGIDTSRSSPEAIGRVLASTIDGSRFAYGIFIPPKGDLIEVNNVRVEHSESPQWFKSLVRQQLDDISHPIDIGDQHYGMVRLALSVDKVAGDLWRAALWALALSLGGLMAGVALNRAWRHRIQANNIVPSAPGGISRFESTVDDAHAPKPHDAASLLASGSTEGACQTLARHEDRHTHALDMLRDLIKEIQPLGHDTPETDNLDELVARITTLIHDREKGWRDEHDRNVALVQHAIVSVSNLNGDIVYANDQFCEISGYTRAELIGGNHRIVNSGFHPPEVFTNLWLTITSGKVWHGQLQNRKKSGELYWVEVTIAPLLDDSGLPHQYISIRSDITASKNAELEIERKRLALADIIEGTNAGTWEWDTATGAMILNERWAQMIGYTLEELGPMNIAKWSSFFHPEDLSRMAVQQEHHMNGELPSLSVESRVRHKDGHWVWVLDGGKLITREDDGRPSLMAGTRMDISERKRAELEMQRSEQLLRSSIEAIDEAFVLYDADDRLVLCNEKYRSYYPSSKELVVPGARFEDIVRNGAESGRIQDAKGRAEEWVAERMASHRAGDITQIQRFDDGRILRVIDRHMPDGHIVGLRVDITELVRASEAAEAASLAKSQFLANMSHELRTPMNSVLGMLTLLRKTNLTGRQLDYVNKSQGAARSLLGLLNEILDFSKIEAGKMTLDLHPFDMEQSLRDLSVILSSSIGTKPVELIFDIDTTLPRQLLGDAMRLQQVLINLCGNAIKFTAQGEVTLAIKVQRHVPGEVTLGISVRDTGIGIAPENLARIFSGFTQAEASTTRRFGGTGLGLSISHRLVALMGGELKVDSALGQGSCFHFNITLQESIGLGLGASGARTSSPMRALIVDDNPSARRTLEAMARSLGWQAESADSGEAALARLEQQAGAGQGFQVVFMDYELPDLDDRRISQRMREASLPGVLTVIATVTANGAESLAQRSADKPTLLDGIVIKPATPSMLLDAVLNVHDETTRTSKPRMAAETGVKNLEHMRVLVVEDNVNNQQLVREMLVREGATVRIVDDGQQAVDVIAASVNAFDVVLMDLQMPVMDGLTATRMIRRELGLTTLPIVAMTANALDSDRQTCLAAGMNEHVGKPFELDHLIRVLRKQAGWKDAPKASAPVKLEQPGDAVHQAAEAAGVSIEAALSRLGGKREIYRDVLRSITKDFLTMPKQLRDHLARNEMEQAVRLLHTLKGLSATLGATALSTAMASAEKQLKGSETAAPETHAVTIERACEALTNAIPGLATLLAVLQTADGAATATEVPPQTQELDVPRLQATLKDMVTQLDNADMAATDTMTRLQQHFGFVLGDKLSPLEDAIGTLDFTLASRLCTELLSQIEHGMPAVPDASVTKANPSRSDQS